MTKKISQKDDLLLTVLMLCMARHATLRNSGIDLVVIPVTSDCPLWVESDRCYDKNFSFRKQIFSRPVIGHERTFKCYVVPERNRHISLNIK